MKHFPLEDITVTMLCDRANITRKTFYRNCESKLDLIDSRTDRVIHDLLIRVHWDSTDPVMLYRNFFTYWGGQSALLTVLHTQEQFVLFTERFTDSCIRNVTYHFIDDFLDGR